LTDVLISHMAGSGIAYMWEQQLLNTPDNPSILVDPSKLPQH
jgi:hypothetical protein